MGTTEKLIEALSIQPLCHIGIMRALSCTPEAFPHKELKKLVKSGRVVTGKQGQTKVFIIIP